jgi:hypothetical protein
MSTNASAKSMEFFAEGKFWEGLAQFCAERKAIHERAALAAATWDDNLKSKGANAESLVFSRLQADVEKFVADQRAVPKK